MYKRANRLDCAAALGLELDELIHYAVWAGNDAKQFTQLEPKERTPTVFRLFMTNDLPTKLDSARRELFNRECGRYKIASSADQRATFAAKLARKPYHVPARMLEAFRENEISTVVFQILAYQDYLIPFDSFNWPYLPDANAALRPLRMRFYTFLMGGKQEVVEWGEFDSRSVVKPLKSRQFVTMATHAPAREGDDEEGEEGRAAEFTPVSLEECWAPAANDDIQLDALLHVIKTCRTKAVDQIAHKLPQWLPVILSLRVMQARWACRLETAQAFLHLAAVSPIEKPFEGSPDCKTPEEIRAHMHIFHSAYLFVTAVYDACGRPFSKHPSVYPAAAGTPDQDLASREWLMLLLEGLELNFVPQNTTPVNVFEHKEAAELLLQCPLPFRCKYNWGCRIIEKCKRFHVNELSDIPTAKHKDFACPCGLVAPKVQPLASEADWEFCTTDRAAKKKVAEAEREAAAKAAALEEEKAARQAEADREAEAAAFAKRAKEKQDLEDAKKAAIAAEFREKKAAKKAAKSAPTDEVPEEAWMTEPDKVKKSKPKKK